jgi:hypothetical protein
VTLYATETVPSPLVLEAVVITDPSTRSVAVRLPETAGGGSRMWWKTAHTALAGCREWLAFTFFRVGQYSVRF